MVPPPTLRHPLPQPPTGSARAYPYPNPNARSNSTSPSWASSSSNHPSPAASSTSSGGSSLRTPPDLLVNGSSVGHHHQEHAKLAKGAVVNTWNGLPLSRPIPKVMGVAEIQKRKALLDTLPPMEGWELPSPPPSPQPQPRQQKRKRTQEEPSDLPPSTLASRYRVAARDLKHRADSRPPSAVSSRLPSELAALEQLEAVLLFCYAFHLDDLATVEGGCITKNWISIFALLRHTTQAHKELHNDALLGVCRWVEAKVLRILHGHDVQRLRAHLEARDGKWIEVKELVERTTADLERSDRLSTQAKHLLSLPSLKEAGFESTWNSIVHAGITVGDSLVKVEELVQVARGVLVEHARLNNLEGYTPAQLPRLPPTP